MASTKLSSIVGGGGTLGELVSFSSKAAMAASGNFLPLDGSVHLWADYPDFDAAINSIPPSIMMDLVSNTASEAGNAAASSFGGFKSFGTDMWVFPSKTAQKLTSVTGATWDATASADLTVATASIPKQVQFRDDDGGEGCLVSFQAANSIIDYSTVTTLLSGWTAIDLNATISLTASSQCEAICNSGSSGRWYSLWSNSTNLQIAYSAVDDVSTGWALWGGTVTHGGSGSVTEGSIAVKEGSAWIWTSRDNSNTGKIYGTTSIGGVASLLLDVSPTTNMFFRLSYDINEDIFIALPAVRGYHIYTSADSGVTWDKGDMLVQNTQHRAVKVDNTEHIYIFPITTSGSTDNIFQCMKRDADGCMRLIQTQDKDGTSDEYYSSVADNASRMIASNPGVSLASVRNNATNAYSITIDANLTTEFTTMNIFNYKGSVAGNGGIIPIGTYLGMRVNN